MNEGKTTSQGRRKKIVAMKSNVNSKIHAGLEIRRVYAFLSFLKSK